MSDPKSCFLWYSVSTDRRGEKEMQWRKERTVKDRFLEREKLNKMTDDINTIFNNWKVGIHIIYMGVESTEIAFLFSCGICMSIIHCLFEGSVFFFRDRENYSI